MKHLRNKLRKYGRRDPNYEFGTNPCSEIILRPYQFCNLTEVVVRATDTVDDLERKVKLATILGTIQSSFTKFPYLRKVWQRNTEEERLLGVSLTGIMDNKLLTSRTKDWRRPLNIYEKLLLVLTLIMLIALAYHKYIYHLRQTSAEQFSNLLTSASGIHARHSKHYIRTVRGDNKDPLTQFMKDQGIPNEPCVLKEIQLQCLVFL